MSDDFLARWSRRKLEVRKKDREPAPPKAAAREGPAPGEMPEQESEPELTPEEIAALPPVEDLTAESDFTLFLRKGVPERLKNAALRRMWSLDPAIRDHVGDARDYAYDWNAPGGVPGAGPLLPTDDVRGMLRQIFEGPAVGGQQENREAADPVRPGQPSHVREQESSASEEATAESVAREQSDALPEQKAKNSSSSSDDAPEEWTERKLIQSSRTRRHGRAKPE
jgi:hypothetical protein